MSAIQPKYRRYINAKAFAIGLILVLALLVNIAVAQRPAISYAAPPTYTVNQPITSLSPVNTGGAVATSCYRQVSTVAGSTQASIFLDLTGIAVDPQGNIYVDVWDFNQVENINPAGVVTLLAGSTSQASGTADGQGTAARFSEPDGLVIDAAGNLYVSDQQTNLIRKITPGGLVTTIAGSSQGFSNGTGTSATFYTPRGLAIDPAGNLYVADQSNNAIRKITPAGVVTTIAGNGASGLTNGIGTAATFNTPTGVGIDKAGNLYIADAGNNVIRKITPGGAVTTFATGFNFPREVKVDDSGTLYVTDQGSYSVKQVTAAGVVSTVAGTGQSGSTNGNGNVATFLSPIGLALDGLGNLFIADNALVRKIAINGYVIDKPLPAGLVFDPTTGIISGTPTTASPATIYTITAYNGSGSNSTTLSIAVTGVTVVLNPPNISYTTPNIYTINKTIAALAPVNTGGAVPATIYGTTTTFAGSGSIGSADGIGIAASFNRPYSLNIDASGNLYVADTYNNLIRKITSNGTVTTLAGNGSAGATNGTSIGASFYYPGDVAVDASGNLFVGDQTNNMIREITQAGVVTTFAGSGAIGASNGVGATATFAGPNGVAFDGTGNLFVADRINNQIRQITPLGVVSTLAGSGGTGATNGPGNLATFNNPSSVATDVAGNVYVTDQFNNQIRKITPAGLVSIYAGSGVQGATDGPAMSASFNKPFGLTTDRSGDIFVADEFNNTIRRISTTGKVSTLAGSGTISSTNGVGSAATFNYPSGIISDHLGNVYVTEVLGYNVRKVIATGYTIDKALPAGLTFDPTTGSITGTPVQLWPLTTYTVTAYNADGSSATAVDIEVTVPPAPNISYPTPQKYFVTKTISALPPTNTGGAVPATIYSQVSTYAGTGVAGSTNGALTTASFKGPNAMVVDPSSGNMYIADRTNNLIRKITSAGVVSTLAGSGLQGARDGAGTSASFNLPTGIAVDGSGNVYVADYFNYTIRKITPTGLVTTFAGSGALGSTNGTGTAASFYFPSGIAVDGSGNLFVADYGNNLIRKITSSGVVTTFAGSGASGSVNGIGTAASFGKPYGITIDFSGNLYVADNNANMIRKITPAAVVSSIGTTGTYKPTAVAADYAGNIFVVDQISSNVLKITAAGIVTTLAGTGTKGSVNGVGTSASFGDPSGICADQSGNLFIADFNNNLIRKIIVTGYTIDKALPAGLVFDATTGIITGTPAVVSPATDYTVTAYNVGGSSSTIVNIEVEPGLTFPAIPAKTICTADFDPGATTIIPGATITYTSSNTAVATIISGKIHVVGAGTSVITANDTYSSLQQTLTVTAPVVPTISITPNQTSVCAGMAVSFSAAVLNAGSSAAYQWQLNGVNYGSNSSALIVNNIRPTDVVQCTVTNNDSCPQSATSNQVTGIVVNPYVAPAVSITSSAAGAVCPGTNITFTATPTNGGTSPTYQWQVNGANVGSGATTYSSNTFANGDVVTCILTASGGCFAPVTATSNSSNVAILAPANPGPTATISASANNVYLGSTITFTVIPVNAGTVTSYQWMVNNVDRGTNSNTFTTNTLNSNDVVTCTLTFSSGCVISIVSTPFVVTLLPLPPVTIPNTFTPNNDGVNDTWDITNLVYYPTSMVSVYNRFGSLIFQSKGYSQNWDGTYKGALLPVGTYYYLVDLGAKTPALSGSVTIVR